MMYPEAEWFHYNC